MTGILAIDVRRAGPGEWLVGHAIPESAHEVTATGSRESIFSGQPLTFACVPSSVDRPEFLLIAPTAEDGIVKLQLSPEVVEEIYGPPPDSDGWLTWLRKNARYIGQAE